MGKKAKVNEGGWSCGRWRIMEGERKERTTYEATVDRNAGQMSTTQAMF